MADTVPVHNRMSVDLANVLGDPVSGGDNGIKAAADGKITTADIRNRRLHEAYAWIAEELSKKVGMNEAKFQIEGLIKTQAISFSSSGVALNKNYLLPIVLSSSSVFQRRSKEELDRNTDIRLSYGYAIEGGKLYAYGKNALSTATINETVSFPFGNQMSVPTANVGLGLSMVANYYQGWRKQNLVTGQNVGVTVYSYNSGTDTATFTFDTTVSWGVSDFWTLYDLTSTFSLLNAGTGTFYYIMADRIDATTGEDVAINTAPDTVMDRKWLYSCLNYAAYRIAMDKGTAFWLDKAKMFYQEAYSRLNG